MHCVALITPPVQAGRQLQDAIVIIVRNTRSLTLVIMDSIYVESVSDYSIILFIVIVI